MAISTFRLFKEPFSLYLTLVLLSSSYGLYAQSEGERDQRTNDHFGEKFDPKKYRESIACRSLFKNLC